MITLSLVTQKGGSGKSTLTASIAVAAAEAGNKVIVIDTDRQGTLDRWAERRDKETPEVVSAIDTDKLPPALKAIEGEGYDVVLIDTAGVDSPSTAAAIRASDLCLIPSRPSPADVEAATPTIATVVRLDKPFAFILNQCPPRSYRVNETAKALGTLGILAEPVIVLRNDHQDALGAGYGVTEYAPDSKAADEVRALWRWIEKRTKRVKA